MKPDEFEKQLEQQPMRPVPPAWREQILFTARQAAASAEGAKTDLGDASGRTWLEALKARLLLLLWPAPKAWAGLAAVWLAIAVLNFSTPDPAGRSVSYLNSSQVRLALKEQQQALAEIVGENQPSASNQPQPVTPGPRSETHAHRAAV